jgi:hypothetical protein
MAIYDQWPYMTIVDIPEMRFTAVSEGIKIDGLLFEESREEQTILQENCPLTVQLQRVVQKPVFVVDIIPLFQCNESVRQQLLIRLKLRYSVLFR